MRFCKKVTSCLFAAAVVLLCLFALPKTAQAASESDLRIWLNDSRDGYNVMIRNREASGELVIPATYKGLPVTTITAYGFRNCTGLTKIVIPDSVTEIKEGAFTGCTGLTTVVMGNGVTNISTAVFSGCTSLASVTLSDRATKISDRAFAGCTSLTDIAIPDGVTEIGYAAFEDCASLPRIAIPDSVTEIGRYAFENCTALTEVVMSRNVTVIDNGTFSGCVSLARINIPSGITRIGTFAFYECDSLACSTYGGGKYLGNSQDPYLVLIGVTDKTLRAYEIHPSTKILYDHSFFQCNNAAEFTVPASVIQIDPGAFMACKSLVRLQVAQENPVYHSEGNCIIETAGKTLVAGCKASVIPADGSVTAIGTKAFEFCHGLTQIALPSTITTIGEQAFDACDGLTSITLPDSVTTIGEQAFASCRKLTYVRLPENLSTLESFVLSYCISLTGIEIPDSVQAIDSYAFSGCRQLERITLPDGVTSIGTKAFYNCAKLARIILPDSVQTVGESAFAGCEQLNEVFYAGNQAQWDTLLSAVAAGNDPLRNATVHFNYFFQPASVLVYVDRTNLRVATGETITLRAMVQDALGNYGDPANITFQLNDSSLVDVEASGFEGDSLYIRLRGVNPGEITVTFSDSVTGYATAVPITVYANRYHSYTISNVPNTSSFGLDANFANANGLYIANYSYKINDDESTRVTFDAYNSNYIYGLVEVYTQDGQLQDAVLINKASKDNTSIKALVWDGAVCHVKAVLDHSISTFQKYQHTSVTVDIPKNGYIKITCDPAESDQVMMVNAMHIVLQELSLIGDILKFDPNNKEIPEAFVENMVKGTLPAQFKKDGLKYFTNLIKAGAKELTLSSASLGSFSDAFLKRAQELNLIQFLGKSFGGTAIDIAEDAFLKYMGVYGAALEAYFIVGKAENLALSYNDLATAAGGGAITIQNQAGGLRAANRITLESQVDFAPDVALQTYAVALDGEFLEFIQQADQETYELLTQSICHTYNISLLQNGREVQHSDYVTVYIPIPEDLRVLSLAGNVEVYRIEEDGRLTDMDAVVENGFVRFVTNHFSLYVLVGNGVIPGDLDGNMAVDQADVEYLLLHTLFGEADYPLDTAIGDIDGSGSIDQNDVIYLLLHTLFGDTRYPLLK